MILQCNGNAKCTPSFDVQSKVWSQCLFNWNLTLKNNWFSLFKWINVHELSRNVPTEWKQSKMSKGFNQSQSDNSCNFYLHRQQSATLIKAFNRQHSGTKNIYQLGTNITVTWMPIHSVSFQIAVLLLINDIDLTTYHATQSATPVFYGKEFFSFFCIKR